MKGTIMRRNWIIAVVGGLVVVGLAFLATQLFPPTRVLRVDIGLIDIFNGSDCSGGQGGYSDVGPGLPVTVRNEDGTVLGSAALPDTGQVMPLDGGTGGCIWTVAIPVPGGEDQYVVSGGRRGEIAYSRDRLEDEDWHVGLTIGN